MHSCQMGSRSSRVCLGSRHLYRSEQQAGCETLLCLDLKGQLVCECVCTLACTPVALVCARALVRLSQGKVQLHQSGRALCYVGQTNNRRGCLAVLCVQGIPPLGQFIPVGQFPVGPMGQFPANPYMQAPPGMQVHVVEAVPGEQPSCKKDSVAGGVREAPRWFVA